MSPDLKFSFDIAQLVMLGGLIWGLARMSKSVDVLGTVTTELTSGLKVVTAALTSVAGRVSILEDRQDRRLRRRDDE